MKYLSIAEARKTPGLRLVLSAHVPGPWGEAAKAVLSARAVKYVPVEQVGMEANEDLVAWTGIRNAPIAILDDEPPLSNWLEILMLAERLGSGPPLLPADPLERALVLGLSCEICAPEGLGWVRRLNIFGPQNTDAASDPAAAKRSQVLKGYGVRPDATSKSAARIIAILGGLTAQLRRQKAIGSAYLVGTALTACDLYWACFSLMIVPLSNADCPMPDWLRTMYAAITPDIAAAADPALLQHRDMIFRKHIGLPLDF